MSADTLRQSVVVLLLAGLGAGLLLVPWLNRPRPAMPLPEEILPGTFEQERLLQAVEAVDAACHRGDLAAFAASTSPARQAQFADRVQRLGQKFDGSTLRLAVGPDGTGLGAELRQLRCLGGLSAGDRACLLFVPAAPASEDGTVRAVGFTWDGADFRLDRVQEDRARPGEARADVAETLAQQLLLPVTPATATRRR